MRRPDGLFDRQEDPSPPEADERASRASTDTMPSGLLGDSLSLGYPSSEESVVDCDRVLFPTGEITALVGPNGSGKSTLLKAMAAQLSPDEGRIHLDGRQIQTLDSKQVARRIGLLSQDNQSPTSLTVEELAYHGRYPHRGFLETVSEADEAAVTKALNRAGIEELRDAELGALSGGQKQLAWIAMVLAQETDVLLLDEPTTFLDLHHQLRVMGVVRTLNQEEDVTVGVVLHDVGQAARFADNLIALKDGSLYDWGPPTEVLTETLMEEVFRVEATVDVTSPTGPHISPHSAMPESQE